MSLKLGKQEEEIGRLIFESRICLRLQEGARWADFGCAVLVLAKDMLLLPALAFLLTTLDTLVDVFPAALATQVGFNASDLSLAATSAIVAPLVKPAGTARHFGSEWIRSVQLLQFRDTTVGGITTLNSLMTHGRWALATSGYRTSAIEFGVVEVALAACSLFGPDIVSESFKHDWIIRTSEAVQLNSKSWTFVVHFWHETNVSVEGRETVVSVETMTLPCVCRCWFVTLEQPRLSTAVVNLQNLPVSFAKTEVPAAHLVLATVDFVPSDRAWIVLMTQCAGTMDADILAKIDLKVGILVIWFWLPASLLRVGTSSFARLAESVT